MNKIIHGPTVGGQSLADRMNAAKHTITGQDLVKAVYKATTDEVMGPKRKHLDYLIWCTKAGHVPIPELVKHLLERTQSTSWVVVLKALLTIHDIINYGNEQFTQYLSSSQHVFHLGYFNDKTDRIGYHMSSYIRCYAKYLNEKLNSYRVMGYDFCKVKRGKEDGFLRKMEADQLLKSLPVLQTQLDTLLEFNVSPDELTNGVISFCFLAVFQDMIRLFACYNDGIINLLEKFFDLSQQQCKDALLIYKKFISRMDAVRTFLRVAEMVGVNKSDIPDLAEVPDGLYEALEDHMKSFSTANQSDAAASSRSRPSAGVTSAISKFSAAAHQAAAPGAGSGALTISDDERHRILEEEQRQLDILRNQKKTDKNGGAVQSPTTDVYARPQKLTSSVGTPVAPAKVSQPSRVQSVPAADTSTWTRMDDDESMEAKPVTMPPGFTGFGDMLKPTKSPSAIETERKTQSNLLAHSMSLDSGLSPQTAMSATSGVASPAAVPMVAPTYVVPTIQLYSPTPLPYTPPQWGQPGMMMMSPPAAGPWPPTATSPPLMRPAGFTHQPPRYPSGAV